jgi:GT2 family glycosyltransferase
MATTLIIPVYNALSALKRCLDSLARHAHGAVELLLIDDASPDPAIAELLLNLPELPAPHRILRNTCNLGFVGSVNRGIAETTGDVLLLNSDTVVTEGWLARIETCAASDPRIASITPWSNNAEICSIPGFCRANPEPADPDAVARAIAAGGDPHYPELPTGVGFCFWLRRAALIQLGGFDQATFGRGYGEENDWCRRAARHGWRNVLCDDAYVVHQGGQSFAAEGHQPGGENLRRLSVRYPDYERLVAEFIAADPLVARRQTLIKQVGLKWDSQGDRVGRG